MLLQIQTCKNAMIPLLLSLQCEFGASSSAVVPTGNGKQLAVGEVVGSKVKDLPKMMDVNELKELVSGLSFLFLSVFHCHVRFSFKKRSIPDL